MTIEQFVKIGVKRTISAIMSILDYCLFNVLELLLRKNKYTNFKKSDPKQKKSVAVSVVDIEFGHKNHFYKVHTVGFCNKNNIKRISQKLNVFNSVPEYYSYNDVLYYPARRSPFINGGLYTAQGKLINASALFRGYDRNEQITKPIASTTHNFKKIKPLHEPYVYIGPIINHYGHFLTECISRLWYVIKNTQKDTLLLFHGNPNVFKVDYIKNFFDLLNIDYERLIILDRPALLSNVVIPYPSMSNRAEIYQIHKLSTQIAAQNALVGRRIPKTTQPLYLSRKNLSRRQRKNVNERELEKHLLNNKIRIIDPQTLDLNQQIHLFNKHKIIIGSIGSAHHNSLFSLDSKVHIYITARIDISSYLMIDYIKDNESYYIKTLSDKLSLKRGTGKNLFLDVGTTIESLKEIGIL
jgi:hypothetical protein